MNPETATPKTRNCMLCVASFMPKGIADTLCAKCADSGEKPLHANGNGKVSHVTRHYLTKNSAKAARDKAKAEAIERGEYCVKCFRGTPEPGSNICYGCAEKAKELRGDIGKPDAPQDSKADGLDFPEDCMYGEAAILAGQLNINAGLGYPALIGCWSVKPNQTSFNDTRINVMVALCSAVGGGKNVAMERARRILALAKNSEYRKASPAGTRALMSLIGDKPSGERGNKTRTAGPRKMLLITHEMTDVLKMTGIDNSTLASRLCDFWDDSEFEYPTKEGLISVDCRLSWVGGVPCSADNPTRFTELFDSETSHGLYDRLILGYSDVRFNYKTWTLPTERTEEATYESLTGDDGYSSLAPREPRISGLSAEAQSMYDAYQPNGGGTRIKQNCMKVALITAMMNKEEVVGEECMRCAVKFMEWQIALRRVLEPGTAINDAARCREVILAAMRRKGGLDFRYINIKRLAHDHKWGARFGDWLVGATIKSLANMGEIAAQADAEDKKSDTMYKLRDFSK